MCVNGGNVDVIGRFVGDSDRLTVHPGQTIHQLADFDIQSVVANIQLVDGLIHTSQSGH